ncbi:hypothetical protein CEXT_804041 [Caerostris extrusa]|uniref:Uncharacterized protein n=1 Tax=Caerostris extrusa TaxID=172846 RepID=A0AAV4Y0Z8_CAEEX|nr:hypothetical protein CEXT_804041 [Caerostris extrusa]
MKRRWGLISLNTSLEGIMASKYFVFSSRNKVSINFECRWFLEWNRCFLNGRSLRAITQRICNGNRLQLLYHFGAEKFTARRFSHISRRSALAGTNGSDPLLLELARKMQLLFLAAWWKKAQLCVRTRGGVAAK